MEKENKLFQTSIDILENMENSDFKKIKSGTGLLDLSCTLVEESYNRLNKASDIKFAPWKGKEKKETAVLLLTPLMQKLKEKEIINDSVQNLLIDFVSRESIEDNIDDLIDTWKEKIENIHYKCVKLIKLFRSNKEPETRLSKIKITK